MPKELPPLKMWYFDRCPRGQEDWLTEVLEDYGQEVRAHTLYRGPPPPVGDTRGCPECAHSDSWGLPDKGFCNRCTVLPGGHRGTHFKALNGG